MQKTATATLVEAPSSFTDVFNATLGQSPYGGYTAVEIDDGLLGDGFDLIDFPSLWDMFGKLMGGFDVDDLWGSLL